jgi:hypothetical protein
MCETGKSFGQQWWESAFDSDCCVVHMLSRLTSLQTHSTTTPHFDASPKHWNPDQKPPTLKRGAPSPHLCTLGSSSEPHLPLLWGSNFQVYLTLLPPKPAFDNQPLTNSNFTYTPPNTPNTPNTSSKWSTTLEPLPAVAPATTVSSSPAIPRPACSACCELGTEFCRLRSSASCAP